MAAVRARSPLRPHILNVLYHPREMRTQARSPAREISVLRSSCLVMRSPLSRWLRERTRASPPSHLPHPFLASATTPRIPTLSRRPLDPSSLYSSTLHAVPPHTSHTMTQLPASHDHRSLPPLPLPRARSSAPSGISSSPAASLALLKSSSCTRRYTMTIVSGVYPVRLVVSEADRLIGNKS